MGPTEYELLIVEKSRRAPRWHKVDDTNPSITFAGGWEQREAVPDCFLETEHASTTMGAAVVFTFTEHRAIVYGKVGRGLGNYDAFLDGKFIEQVRCNWGPLIGAPIYQTGLLQEGKHTLKLVKSKAENNGEVTIDWFGYQTANN